jgi:hypothetical protein
MAVIERTNVIEGAVGPYTSAGAPSAGTDEVQTITITGTPTGGTFRLAFEGFTTAAINHNANAAAVQAALRALPPLSGASGDVTCGGGALPGTPVTATFQFNRGRQAVSLMTVADNSLTGGTTPAVAVTETTPGVNATGRGAVTGAQLIRQDNGVQYTNTSTNPTVPTWTVVGSQS